MAYLQDGVEVRVTGRRVVATILDSFVLGVIYQVFTWMFHSHYASGLDFTRLTSRAGLGWLLVTVLYYVLLEGVFGRTVGKAICGIKVISGRTGEAPGIGSAILRTALRVIDGIGGYLLAFIVVLLSARRRRLGDMAADTYVVRG